MISQDKSIKFRRYRSEKRQVVRKDMSVQSNSGRARTRQDRQEQILTGQNKSHESIQRWPRSNQSEQVRITGRYMNILGQVKT